MGRKKKVVESKENAPTFDFLGKGLQNNPNESKEDSDEYEQIQMPNPIFKEIREITEDEQPAKDTICMAIKNLTAGIRSTRKIPHDLMVAMAICSDDEFMRGPIENILAAYDTNDWKAKNYQTALRSLGGPLAAMMLGEVLREGGRGLFGFNRGFNRLNRGGF